MWALLQLWVAVAAPLPPAPEQWVEDQAGALSAATRQTLSQELSAFEQRTGHQLVVYVGRSTGGEPLEDFAVRAFTAWKVGRAKLDDGAALLVMVDDRAARLEVGYGLEEVLTDAQSARILRDELIPRMRAGDPDGAVLKATAAIITVVDRGPSAAPPVFNRLDWVAVAIVGALMLALVIWKPRLALFALGMLLGRGGRRDGGRGFSGGGGRSGGGGATGRW